MLDPGVAYVNVSGTFPDVLGLNASGPSATDGFEFIANFVNDNNIGWMQMLLNHAGLTPTGVVESDSASQVKEALQKGFGGAPGTIQEWNLASDPGTTGHRALLLNGQGILRTNYPDLDAAVYVGDGNNAAVAAAGGAWFRADNSDGSSPNTTGIYLILPESRGVTIRGLDTAASIDPDGAGRFVGDLQVDAFQGFQVGADAHSGGALDLYGELQGINFASSPVPEADTVRARFRNDAQGSSSAVIPKSDGVNGTPRISSETVMYNRSTKLVVWH